MPMAAGIQLEEMYLPHFTLFWCAWSIHFFFGSRHRPSSLSRADSLAYLKVDLSKVQLPPCTPVTLAFSDLSYSVDDNTSLDVEAPGRKFLLKQLSGVVRPGELLAVMGPSGCGKTTFLDLLARRIKSGMKLMELVSFSLYY